MRYKTVCSHLAACMVISGAFASSPAWAGSSNFTGPGFDFNTAGNWDNGVPNDVAGFNNPNPATTQIVAGLFVNVDMLGGENATVNQFLFNPGAGAYTVFLSPLYNTPSPSLTFNGLGITNNSGNTQTIYNDEGSVTFNNNASASNTAIINFGVITFNSNTTADHAYITDQEGSINFNDNSTAGNSTLLAGRITFAGNSTAGNAFVDGDGGGGTLVFQDNSSADHMVFTTQSTYHILFQDSSTAGNATFNTLFTDVTFRGTSTAGNATINALSDLGYTTVTPISFYDSSSAGNATFNLGTYNSLMFLNTSSGASAAVNLNTGSILDISNLSCGGTTLRSLSGSGNVNLGSKSLDLIGDASTTFSGIISGSGGSLVKDGAGTLTLLGANTYSGRTTVNSGALQGNTTSLQGNIINNASLIFDQEVDGTNSATISGSGAVTKIGDGTLTFQGPQSYTGSTFVNAGTLNLLSSLTGDAVVGSNGTLTGTGGLQNLVNNGVVTPGVPGGGSLQAASYSGPGVLNILLNGTSANSLKVSGNANLTGQTLYVTGMLSGPGQFDIVSAGSITGTFANVPVSTLPFLNFQTQYTPTDVFFNVTRSNTTFQSIATTANEQQVATALEQASSNRPANFMNIVNGIEILSALQAQSAYAQMSGDALGSFRTAGLSSAGHFVEQMSNRANPAGPSMQAEATPTQPIQLAYAGDISGLNFLQTMPASLHLWTRGVGIFDHTNANASLGSPSSEADTGGFQTGYDFSIGDTGLLGFSGGYSQTSLTVSDRSSSGNSDAAQFGVYGSYMPDSWIFDGSLAYSGASNANARTIAYHGINETAAASFHSNVYTAFGEAGYVFHPRPVVALEPSVSLRESHMLQEGYTESGAPGLDLTVGEQNSDSLVSSLGLRLSRLFEPQTSHPIGLGVRSAWQHELADVKNLITAQFADAPGAGFTVQSTPESRDAAALGLDVRAGLTKNLQAFANYTATLSSGQNIHSILGGFSLRW